MKQLFAATVLREVKVASQGETEEEALANLKEALELHFEPLQVTRPPEVGPA
jgi:predicted RNase H-like HicB family nuclease